MTGNVTWNNNCVAAGSIALSDKFVIGRKSREMAGNVT